MLNSKTNTQTPVFGSWGVDLSHGDQSVSPGEDFFRHVNGKWMDEFELPADKVVFGALYALADQSQEKVRALIEELVQVEVEHGTPQQKVRDFYLSYMDASRADALGLDPIKERLSQIQGISTVDELMTVFGLAGIEGFYSPISWNIGPNAKAPDKQILKVGVANLSLPDRDFYLQDTEHFKNVRRSFVEHIEEMLGLSEMDKDEARSCAKDILALETRIAKAHWTRSQMRDVEKTYNLYRFNDLCEAFPNFAWSSYFKAGNLPKLDKLIVSMPSAVTGIIEAINDTPLSVWRAYLVYKLLVRMSDLLSDDISEASFRFYGRILSGQEERLPRWKRAIGLVSSHLGEYVGQIYVERHFPPGAKAKMDELVSNVMAAFSERIGAAPWMGQETREMAKKKLSTFRPKIGYPNKWTDYDDVIIKRDDLFGNANRASRHAHDELVDQLGKPTDREKWFMTPQTVNAYYHPLFNEIVFPAAILQPPFFDPAADPAVNYGAIGAVIAHEMSHGFDDLGRKYDVNGILRNWWAEEDMLRCKERTDVLVEQFSSYELLPGAFVNGELTLGENTADLGGLTISYHAYKRSLDGKEAPVIDGLTGEQRFFLSYGQIWRMKMREQAELASLKSAVHSPPVFRVNGALRNVDAWYDAFDIGPEDPLFLPPEERASIW